MQKTTLSSLPLLALPPISPRITVDGHGTASIYDPLRSKWVILTPEEWVRQHFTAFMTDHKGYPRGLVANEVGLTLNGTRRRCDTVVFDRVGARPLMVVEYKAPSVGITRRVFDQILRYNIVLKARWLVVSNGMSHYCCNIDPTTGAYRFVPGLPAYGEIARTPGPRDL